MGGDGQANGDLHLFVWGLLVAIFSPKNVWFELREPELV
jgi:hypothetical protein